MGDRPKDEMQEALAAFLAETATSERPARPVTPVPPTEDPQPKPSGGKEDLHAAYDRLVEHEANKPQAPTIAQPPLWKTYLVPSIGAVSTIAMVFLWVTKPAWLYPPADPVPTAATAWQAQQMLMAAAALSQTYQAETGLLPADLKDLGVDLPGLSIDPDVNGFRIVGGTRAQPMYLRASPNGSMAIEMIPR